MTKEEWLMPGAIVPVDPDTTKALVDEIKRLIGVIGGMALQAAAPVQEPLEEEWIAYCWNKSLIGHRISYVQYLEFVREVERAHGIKEKNNG